MLFRLGALAAAAFALSISASHASVDRFCGDRYCPEQALNASSRYHNRRVGHHQRLNHQREGIRVTRIPFDSMTGIVRSAKTGATARVSPAYRDRFQAFVDDVEAHGGAVYYMGGYRRGHCSLASQHPCGLALDVCQDYRGHVSGARDCHLPRPAEFHAIARAHGLFDGSVWRSSDYGHVQAKESVSIKVAPHGSWGHGRARYARR